MKEYAESFYGSKAWHQCRKAYLSMHPLCERCLKRGDVTPAKIVHHREYITSSNINDINIILDYNNLESLCQSCHNVIHFGESVELNYTFDKDGQLVPMPPSKTRGNGSETPELPISLTHRPST